MRCPDQERDILPVARDAEWPVPIHGGKSPGAAVGNSNARKHGRYTAEAIAERRKIAALIRTMKSLAGQGERQD